MTILDNLQSITKDVQRESKKAAVHQLTVDVKGDLKNYNVLSENVEDAVGDFKRFVFATEGLVEGKHYQIVQLAGGYLLIDYSTKYWRKKNAYKTLKYDFSRDEKRKLVDDLQAELKIKK